VLHHLAVPDVPLNDLLIIVQFQPFTEVGQVLQIHLVEFVDVGAVVREEARQQQPLPILHLSVTDAMSSFAASERHCVQTFAPLVVRGVGVMAFCLMFVSVHLTLCIQTLLE
jgi:hypothetical protein